MEYWLDIGEKLFTSELSYDVQIQWNSTEDFTILLQAYNGQGSLYKLDFGEIIFFEMIDEHLSFPPFLAENITMLSNSNSSGVLFEVRTDEVDNNTLNYFIRSDFYILIKSYRPPVITVLSTGD